MLARMWSKGTLIQCWWKCKLVQPLCRTVQWFLQKLKVELPYDTTIPLLGTCPRKKDKQSLSRQNWALCPPGWERPPEEMPQVAEQAGPIPGEIISNVPEIWRKCGAGTMP